MRPAWSAAGTLIATDDLPCMQVLTTAVRLTLDPLAQCAGPASLVFMGHSLGRAVPRIEKALGLPAGAVTSVSAAKPIVRVQLGQRLVACGAARGLSAPEVPTMAPTPID